MTAGRKPLTSKVPDVIDATLDQPKIEGAMVAMREQGLEQRQQEDAQLAQAAQAVGGALMARLQKNFAHAAEVGMFLQVRDLPLAVLRRIPIPEFSATAENSGGIPQVEVEKRSATAENIYDFCLRVFGRSYNVMQEQAQNLAALGEASFEAASRLGLNRRQLRLIRSLPESERTAVAAAIQAESKSEVVAIIEDLAAQLASERAKTADVQADLAASESRRSVLITENDKLKTRIARATPDDVLLELQKETTRLTNDALGCVQGQLRQAFIALKNHGDGGADHSLFMAGLVGQVQAELAALREEFNLPDISNARDQELAAEVAQWAPKN